jgi:hypothetical protein
MKILKILIVFNILVLFSGCDKNEDSSFLKGNIVGFVKLIDEMGNEVLDKSGINVAIDGLSISANTNVNGRFEFTDVPAGSYKIIYNKTGYGIYKKFSYQFIGGTVPALMNEITLYEQPKIEIQNLDISYKNNTISILAKISETNQYSFQIFFSDSSNVSYQNNIYSSARYNFCCAPVTQFSESIYLSYIPNLNRPITYMVIYFVNRYESSSYYDYEKEVYCYTGYKQASEIIQLVPE